MITLEELKQEVLSEYDEKVIALAQHLNLTLEIDEELNEEEKEEAIQAITDDLDSIVETFPNNFRYGNEEYLVLTDNEADKENRERLREYFDELVLSRVPEDLHIYIDEDRWIDDAEMDGRGHNLSLYDGTEYEEMINGTWYFIYRQN